MNKMKKKIYLKKMKGFPNPIVDCQYCYFGTTRKNKQNSKFQCGSLDCLNSYYDQVFPKGRLK